MLLGLSLRKTDGRTPVSGIYPQLGNIPSVVPELTWDLARHLPLAGRPSSWAGQAPLHPPPPPPFPPRRTKPRPSAGAKHVVLAADLTWEESASPQLMTVSPRAADPAQEVTPVLWVSMD